MSSVQQVRVCKTTVPYSCLVLMSSLMLSLFQCCASSSAAVITDAAAAVVDKDGVAVFTGVAGVGSGGGGGAVLLVLLMLCFVRLSGFDMLLC